MMGGTSGPYTCPGCLVLKEAVRGGGIRVLVPLAAARLGVATVTRPGGGGGMCAQKPEGSCRAVREHRDRGLLCTLWPPAQETGG
jgi:hypothetical protein